MRTPVLVTVGGSPSAYTEEEMEPREQSHSLGSHKELHGFMCEWWQPAVMESCWLKVVPRSALGSGLDPGMVMGC